MALRLNIIKRAYHVASFEPTLSSSVIDQMSSSLHLPAKSCKLLCHTLDKHVPKLGFTQSALLATLNEHGYSSAAKSVFPDSSRGGALDLVLAHLARSRIQTARQAQKLISKSKSKENPTYKYDIPIQTLFLNRLKLNEPIAHHLIDAQAILTAPGNVPQALSELHQLSDDFCFYSGDRSHSFDWYSKRMSVSALFVASELFMGQDKSTGFRDTKEFVFRRFNEIEDGTYAVDSVAEWSSFFVRSSSNVLKSILARG